MQLSVSGLRGRNSSRTMTMVSHGSQSPLDAEGTVLKHEAVGVATIRAGRHFIARLPKQRRLARGGLLPVVDVIADNQNLERHDSSSCQPKVQSYVGTI
jgi:hypothetical protein